MQTTEIKKRRRKQRQRRLVVLAVMSILALLAIAYLLMSLYFKKHFYFRTEVNGLKVGGKTTTEAEEKIAREVGDYLLTIQGRDGATYHVMGREIGSSYVPDGSLERALEEQNMFAWLPALFRENQVDVPTPMIYDEEALRQTVAALPCFAEENIVHPANATLERTENGYQIQPEIMGNEMVLEQVIAYVGEAVNDGAGLVVLPDEAYVNPQLTQDSPAIVEALGRIEQILQAEVTYQIADYDEKLSSEQIFQMLQVGEDYSLALDEKKLADFVQGMASKYNTYGDVRQFATSSGDTVAIGGGDYGWVIDKEKEAIQLKEDVLSGQKVSREPVYSQRAKVEGLEDIGNTYVEVDYTKQHLWYYEDGQLKLESDFVSGNIAKGNGSPDGLFKIVYKKSPAVLKGEDYASDVDYFMPFAYNVGFHDASWRDKFGGNYYKTSGSHGCINMPGDKAKQLYEMLEVDTPVIAFYREKIELTAENCGISNAYSYVKPPKEEQ